MCTRRFNKPRAAFAIIANFYSETAAPNPQIDLDRLEMATDQAIAACGGDARNAVKALIVANEFLEAEMKQLQAAVSNGYARGMLPRDRKDWYD